MTEQHDLARGAGRGLAAAPQPLTEAQNGLWYGQRLDPANPIYNTGQYVLIDGPLSVDGWRAAVDATLAEADALAVRLIDTDDGPVQVPDPLAVAQLVVVDLQREANPLAAARAHMARDMGTAIDPTEGPLAASVLFVLGPQQHAWYLRVHHLVIDGYGMALLEARVAARYAAQTANQDSAQAALTSTAFGHVAAVWAEAEAYRTAPRRDTDRAYWMQAFESLPAVAALADGTPVSAHTFLREEVPFSADVIAALQTLADTAQVPWPDVLTALTAAYLCRHTPETATVVGVPYMGRLGSASARVPAMVMNVLPLHVSLNEDQPMAGFLLEVARAMQRARRHGRYRSEQLRRDLGLLGGRRRLYGPLINILPFDADMALPGLSTQRHVLGTGPVDDLSFHFRADPAGHGLALALDANPALYSHDDVVTHLKRLGHFLATALRADTLADVPTLTPDETQHWLYGVNDTAHPVDSTTLVALVTATMQAYPQASALTDEHATYTYGQLDAYTAALAVRLAAAGVQRGDIVAVALPRSPELVAALVGIQRAGAAYLPLDTANPPERLAAIIDSAKPPLTLTTEGLRSVLPAQAAVLDMVPLSAGIQAPAEPLPAPPGPHDAAYVIYTSGSTGAPKGVVVEHDAIVNRLEWMRTHYAIGPDERILQKTPATFDVSVWEFFLPLIAGATLVVAPPEAHKDPAWLAALVRQQRVSTLHFVPSMLAAFLAEPAAAGLQLRHVFCSGEELPAALRDRFHAVVQAELHNLYGPTEAAVDVSYWPATRDDTSQPVPIGFPVWNTALYILDDRLRPVPPGVAGHLFLAGRQLARGYLGRADLTDARFVDDPFGRAGARMYATGDLARWRADGAVVFLGRSDHQVKIRGLRVELGEIESILATAPGVAQVAVIAREDRPGDKHIVAYVVPQETGLGHDLTAPPGGTPVSLDTATLRSHLAARVPDYMVPSAFVGLPALPVTRNGKLDRAALPAPQFAGTAGRAPTPGTEARLATLYAQVLERPATISADDDFFDLGGHSLLAARLMMLIRAEWGHAIGLGALFERATVARLAAYLDTLDTRPPGDASNPGNEGFGPVMTLAEPATPLPALFCIHPAGGLGWCYGALARALQPARPAYAIQALALDTTTPLPTRLDTMAAGYVDTLVALQPQGPYHLAGWSVGGIIAQAMAAELARRGLPVGVVALLDAYPSDCWRAEPEPQENAALKALLHIAGYDPDTLTGVPLEREAVIGFLRRSGHPLGELTDAALEGVVRVVESNNRLVREHYHRRYDGTLLYFRAALDHAGKNLYPGQWAPYAGAIDVHDVPSLHAHLTSPQAVSRIAPVLNQQLAQADGSRGG